VSAVSRIGIFYHSDPAGHVPSGVDSFIRGMLQHAPPDLQYTLYGASSDPVARPVGRPVAVQLGGVPVRYVPLVDVSPAARKRWVPDTVRYMQGLRRYLPDGEIALLDVLDFHRIEPLWLFRDDARPKNLVLHQDMSVLREPGCDILWRHAPWAYELIERRSFERVRSVSVVRESAVQRYRALYPGMAGRFAFLPTWFDPATFSWSPEAAARESASAALRSRFGVPHDAALLVAVGRLDRQKDPMLLLSAVEHLLAHGREVHLLMVGDGVMRADVEARRALPALAGSVTLAGALPRADIAAVLAGADVFVMSSAYEGMPIAVLEALASGLPVASTDVGEVARVVRNGVNGWLSETREVAALASAIARTLDAHDSLAGAPCANSVAEFRPERVLRVVHDRHREQAAAARAAA
jgi:glycosyltransferase involved in cell wall biosynthesis